MIQLVSTNQAVMDRRLDAVSPSEWNDLQIDLTPRDTVLEYLQHSFPTTCMEMIEDGASYYLCDGDWYLKVGRQYRAVAPRSL